MRVESKKESHEYQRTTGAGTNHSVLDTSTRKQMDVARSILTEEQMKTLYGLLDVTPEDDVKTLSTAAAITTNTELPVDNTVDQQVNVDHEERDDVHDIAPKDFSISEGGAPNHNTNITVAESNNDIHEVQEDREERDECCVSNRDHVVENNTQIDNTREELEHADNNGRHTIPIDELSIPNDNVKKPNYLSQCLVSRNAPEVRRDTLRYNDHERAMKLLDQKWQDLFDQVLLSHKHEKCDFDMKIAEAKQTASTTEQHMVALFDKSQMEREELQTQLQEAKNCVLSIDQKMAEKAAIHTSHVEDMKKKIRDKESEIEDLKRQHIIEKQNAINQTRKEVVANLKLNESDKNQAPVNSEEMHEQEIATAVAYTKFQYEKKLKATISKHKKQISDAKAEYEKEREENKVAHEQELKDAVENAREEERDEAERTIEKRVIEARRKDEAAQKERARKQVLLANKAMLEANERFIRVMKKKKKTSPRKITTE